MRLSAFPVVSNDPPLLVDCIAPVAAHFSLLFSSSFWWWWWSSSSSRWESSTNRSMSCVGIEVFLSLCRTAKREVSALFSKRCAKTRAKRPRRPNDRVQTTRDTFLRRMREETRSIARRVRPPSRASRKHAWGRRRTIVKIYALVKRF